MSTDGVDYGAFLKIIDEAPQGPWEYGKNAGDLVYRVGPRPPGEQIGGLVQIGDEDYTGERLARYIATFHPGVTRALVLAHQREQHLLNYTGMRWCPICGGSGNGPGPDGGGACGGCGGEGLVPRAEAAPA